MIVVSLSLPKFLRMKKIILLLAILSFCFGCVIKEEYTFNEDGSGKYEMEFDMTEFMSMQEEIDSTAAEKSIDTVINFARLLEEKKDSISRLDSEEQERLEILRPLQVTMKMNDSSKQMLMKLKYDFKELSDLKAFAEAIDQANIKELNDMSAGNQESEQDSTQQDKPDIFSMAESFDTYFGKDKFSRMINEEARVKAMQQKDTTMQADDPFADMIRFKQVFRFPYRVKAVNNERAKILSDFKGIELEANMYDLNNNPDFFNIEVIFEQ